MVSSPGRVSDLPVGHALSRGWSHLLRRLRESELGPSLLLTVATLLIGLLQYGAPDVPPTALVIPMVIANLVLSPRALPWVLLFILAVLVVVTTAARSVDGRRVGGVLVVVALGLVIWVSSSRRTPLGVAGVRGESMLMDLRDRIHHQARMPGLPDDWYAEAVLRSAGGSPFAGDFVVASRSRDARWLQVAVVDVSGKGEQAGSRSLLLSGAFGGLLGALPPDRFLPAANDYLMRQDWPEGFASAVHLTIDLDGGDFRLWSAGHPPGVQLLAGSGRWVVHEAEGPVLGLMDDADFRQVEGTLHRGDTLLLYTDGLVETPQRDIRLGIDKLLGAGEQLLRDGFEHGARRLIDRLESQHDDRALLLLHRR
jgi:hypothetical protein